MSEPPVPAEAQRPSLKKTRLSVTIVTGERIVYDGEADALILPAEGGVITLLPRHAPLLAALEPGELDVRIDGEEQNLAIGGGFVEVVDNRVTVLADTAEWAAEIDIERAEEARRRAQELLKRYRDQPELYAASRQALLRSRARLRVARKVRRQR